jgi:hypothetical protein
MTDKTFAIAGISTRNGSTKFRFTNNVNYLKVLERDSHTGITLYTLAEPMSKEAATQFLLDNGHVEDRAATQPKTASKPKAVQNAERKQDEAILALMAAGELVHDEATDEFVEPKDEAVQVAMSRLAQERPTASAQELYDTVMSTFKQFGEYEPTF